MAALGGGGGRGEAKLEVYQLCGDFLCCWLGLLPDGGVTWPVVHLQDPGVNIYSEKGYITVHLTHYPGRKKEGTSLVVALIKLRTRGRKAKRLA